MTGDLTHAILKRAYELDGQNLDQQAQRLGADNWLALTSWLEFHPVGTGGGCGMLTAALPEGRVLEITDGQAGVPTSVNAFWLAIMLEDDDEYVLQIG